MIDSYERQIYALRRELAQRDDPGTVSEEATPNYKGLIKVGKPGGFLSHQNSFVSSSGFLQRNLVLQLSYMLVFKVT